MGLGSTCFGGRTAGDLTVSGFSLAVMCDRVLLLWVAMMCFCGCRLADFCDCNSVALHSEL